MIRSAFIRSLTLPLCLSLCFVAGCDKDPAGTTPPDDGGSANSDTGDKTDGSSDGGSAGDGGSASDGGSADDPTQKVCDAEVAEYPAPYFEDTVLIRLPKNVTEDNFIEMQPGFVRIATEIESTGCVTDLPGAMISFMALSSFEEDKAKDMTTYRDEVLAAYGYIDVEISEEEMDEKGRFYQAVLDVPPDENKPAPARALFQLKAANGMMYAVVFETHPNAWNAIKNTFRESAKRMSFLAP